ncbi:MULTISPECIES: hypothetical protein [unclassified Nocardia]|uniref:DUF6907 domain-containing protein n=1 Tax=unclassified Nocardia TaxID=2637762 RepID=UPI00278C9015|nr:MULTISPECIES: hypothetical protein [unclassified Nocardia]
MTVTLLCPSWCHTHADTDLVAPGHGVSHFGVDLPVQRASGHGGEAMVVQLYGHDRDGRRRVTVDVMLPSRLHVEASPRQARKLARVLRRAAAAAEAGRVVSRSVGVLGPRAGERVRVETEPGVVAVLVQGYAADLAVSEARELAMLLRNAATLARESVRGATAADEWRLILDL